MPGVRGKIPVDIKNPEQSKRTKYHHPPHTGAGFFMPSKPSSAGGYVPILPGSFPPLVRRPTARRRHFFARVHQDGICPKMQDRRKGHLKARHGVLYPCGYPYIPAPQNAAQRPPEGRAGHKSTPARSVRSKPGLYHLFRARESTAQRSLSASYQAQAYRVQFVPYPFGLTGIPLHALTCSAISNSGQPLYSSFPLIVSSVVVASKKSFHSCFTSREFLK